MECLVRACTPLCLRAAWARPWRSRWSRFFHQRWRVPTASSGEGVAFGYEVLTVHVFVFAFFFFWQGVRGFGRFVVRSHRECKAGKQKHTCELSSALWRIRLSKKLAHRSQPFGSLVDWMACLPLLNLVRTSSFFFLNKFRLFFFYFYLLSRWSCAAFSSYIIQRTQGFFFYLFLHWGDIIRNGKPRRFFSLSSFFFWICFLISKKKKKGHSLAGLPLGMQCARKCHSILYHHLHQERKNKIVQIVLMCFFFCFLVGFLFFFFFLILQLVLSFSFFFFCFTLLFSVRCVSVCFPLFNSKKRRIAKGYYRCPFSWTRVGWRRRWGGAHVWGSGTRALFVCWNTALVDRKNERIADGARSCNRWMRNTKLPVKEEKCFSGWAPLLIHSHYIYICTLLHIYIR